MSIDTPEYSEEEAKMFQEQWEEIPKKKLSINQHLMKIFLTSDIKNKKLWKPLSSVKSELIRNFHDGWFDANKVNALFWVYFNDNRDIFVPRHLQSFVAKQEVFVDGVDCSLVLDEYFSILQKIRVTLEPFTQNIQQFLTLAKDYAHDVVHRQGIDDMYSSFDQEEVSEQYLTIAKKKFLSLLASEKNADDIFTDAWFTSLCDTIWNTREKDAYKDLIYFAVLGMHYFNKKNLVYRALSQENLINSPVSFVATKGDELIEITVWDFLAIVEQLNFKKNFFDM